MKEKSRLAVTRHTTLERLDHYLNIAALAGLAFSGFTIYFGLPYLDYANAYALHILSAALFVAVNLILIPYTILSNGRLAEHWFWAADARRLWAAASNFLTGSEYPRYTIYDERKRRFRNRLHPAAKLLLYAHYAAFVTVVLSGLVLYAPDFGLVGVNVSGAILKVLDFAAPFLTLSGAGLARLLHLAAAYWFVIEVVLHAGLVQLDPRKFQHMKSIFITGQENLLEDPTAEVLNMLEDD